MAFPRNPAGKTVVDGLNPGIVMRVAGRPYFYIQDTCQVHPILFIINDGHGIFIQRHFRIGTNRFNSPQIDSHSQPGHPADRKPVVDGNEFPDYDQSHLLKTQES